MPVLHRATPERLSAFSDGVFAVLITVLVLELRPPELPTFKAFLLLWPTWLSYAVSYLFIAIVWTNHHYLMRYATEATPRLLWFNFAHLFSMSLLPLSTAWMAVSRLAPQPVAFLRSGLLPRERNLHMPHLGAHSPKPGYRGSIDSAPDHALPIDHDFMPFRGGCVGSAEISAGWTRNLYLLPDRLSQARSAGSREAEISAINAETGSADVIRVRSSRAPHRSDAQYRAPRFTFQKAYDHARKTYDGNSITMVAPFGLIVSAFNLCFPFGLIALEQPEVFENQDPDADYDADRERGVDAGERPLNHEPHRAGEGHVDVHYCDWLVIHYCVLFA